METGGKTAFVFAGGGSLGAVQVGMLRVLLAAGVRPDFVIGTSVGAMNAAYFATRKVSRSSPTFGMAFGAATFSLSP